MDILQLQFVNLLYLFSIIPLAAFSQDHDKNYRFQNLFNSEMRIFSDCQSIKDHPETKTKASVVKVKIPSNCLDSLFNSRPYLPGISDPGLDSVTSFTQAFYRSLFINRLMGSTSISALSDDFETTGITDNKKLRFEELYEIKTNAESVRSIDVTGVEKIYLNSGECLVWVPEISDEAHRKEFKTDCYSMKSILYHKQLEGEAGKSISVYRTEIKLILDVDSMRIPWVDSLTFMWNSKDKSNCSLKKTGPSGFSNSEIRFYYLSDSVSEIDDLTSINVGVPMMHGLWPSLICSLLWQKPAMLNNADAEVGRLSDFFDSKYIKLNRVLSKTDQSVGRLRFSIKDQKLYSNIVIQ